MPVTVVFFHLAECKGRMQRFLSLLPPKKEGDAAGLVNVAYCDQCNRYAYSPAPTLFQEQDATAETKGQVVN